MTDTEPTVDDTTAGEDTGNREAAKWRRQLRETQGERDALVEQVNALRRAQINRHAADVLTDHNDLWLDPAITVDDMLDDTGNVDPGKVSDVLRGVIDRHPSWQAQKVTPPPTMRPTEQLRGGATPSDQPARQTSWSSFLNTKH